MQDIITVRINLKVRESIQRQKKKKKTKDCTASIDAPCLRRISAIPH